MDTEETFEYFGQPYDSYGYVITTNLQPLITLEDEDYEVLELDEQQLYYIVE